MKRDFEVWLKQFKISIADYAYYIDFETGYNHVESIRKELEILNSLIGSKDIIKDFSELVHKYPSVLKVVPILIAKREYEIFARDGNFEITYDFLNPNVSLEQYTIFLEKTGIFNLLENRLISSLVDYVIGVEVGLNSNGRKNRGGHLMENLVEDHLISLGLKKGLDYEKEYSVKSIENRFNIDLSLLSNQGQSLKRFDFVVFVKNHIYAIETNFYSSGGSKLNETARSYEMISRKVKEIENFTFVWITDGKGWFDAKNNLRETFEVLETLYNIDDLNNFKLQRLLNNIEEIEI